MNIPTGLSDFGLYQRSLLSLEAHWTQLPKVRRFEHPKAKLDGVTVSLAFDLQQGLWIARGYNWRVLKEMFGAVSGTARKEGVHLILEAPYGNVTIFGYVANDAPPHAGKAMRGTSKETPGGYAEQAHWVRYDDPSIMAPIDRFAEMMDRATRTPRMKALLREQFHGMISPSALLMLGGTFFVLFGTEVVGGAAAAMTIGRLLGVHQFVTSVHIYAPRAKTVYNASQHAQTSEELEKGAQALAEIISQIITDLSMCLGITALTKIAGRMFSLMMTIAPDRLRAILRESEAKALGFVRRDGYAARHLLKSAEGTPLEPAAIHMYSESCKNKREILVVREPDTRRMTWIEAQHVMHKAKPPWLKASSGEGWHGLVCLPKHTIGGPPHNPPLRASGNFQMGNFRGVTTEIDSAIAARPHAQMFDMPTDGRPMGEPGKGIDYGYTGHNNINLQGNKLIDLGDSYLVVDALGRPFISDLDLATRNQPALEINGQKIPQKAGQHLAGTPSLTGKPSAHREDNTALEYDMNQLYHNHPGAHASHEPSQHGGGGATVIYTIENMKQGKIAGKEYWTPKTKDGWKKERLVIFVPEWNGHSVEPKMYVLDSWEAFRDFAKANYLEFPWK